MPPRDRAEVPAEPFSETIEDVLPDGYRKTHNYRLDVEATLAYVFTAREHAMSVYLLASSEERAFLNGQTFRYHLSASYEDVQRAEAEQRLPPGEYSVGIDCAESTSPCPYNLRVMLSP